MQRCNLNDNVLFSVRIFFEMLLCVKTVGSFNKFPRRQLLCDLGEMRRERGRVDALQRLGEDAANTEILLM